MKIRSPEFLAAVYDAVASIPRGSVATYGLVAALAGAPGRARAVGWALRVLPRARWNSVPWQRVVGAHGRIAVRGGGGAARQVRKLKEEGVAFRSGRVDMSRHNIARAEARKPGRPGQPRRRRRVRRSV